MDDLSLTFYGNPVLREQTQPIESVTDELRALAAHMIEIMRDENGIGLAAPQIGRTERVCVVDIPDEADRTEAGEPLNPGVEQPLALFNPEIKTFSEKKSSYEEGCLSFPKIYAGVDRPVEISVSYLDINGQPQTLDARGLLARCIQHEVDHLNGILFIDRISAVKKVALSGRLKRLRKQTRDGLG